VSRLGRDPAVSE